MNKTDIIATLPIYDDKWRSNHPDNFNIVFWKPSFSEKLNAQISIIGHYFVEPLINLENSNIKKSPNFNGYFRRM